MKHTPGPTSILAKERPTTTKRICQGCGNTVRKGFACPSCFGKLYPVNVWRTLLGKYMMSRKTDRVSS